MTTHAAPARAERVAAARVLVVGDAMLDRYWFGAVDRISPEAPVPIVRVNARREERLGGAANVACNVQDARRPRQRSLTVVGDDEPADRSRRCSRSAASTALLGSDPQLSTIVKLRVIGRAQQLIRIDFENQPDHEVLDEHAAPTTSARCRTHDAVLFSDYGKGGLTHIPRMIERRAPPRQAGAGRSEGQRLRALRRRHRDHAEPRRARAGDRRRGRAKPSCTSARRRCASALGLDGLLLTRSEEGMSLFDAAGHVQVPAAGARGVRRHRRRRHRDRHARGDARLRPALREAMPIANRAGGIVVGKFGTASVSYDELFAAEERA